MRILGLNNIVQHWEAPVFLYCEHSRPRSVPLSTTNPRGPSMWPRETSFFQKHALQHSCMVLPGKDHQWSYKQVPVLERQVATFAI